MPKMTVKGIKEVEDMLGALEKNADKIAERALYEGASVAFHYVATALVDVPTDETNGTEKEPRTGPSTIQKHGLQKSLGIAPFNKGNGRVDTSIGFDGYNSVKTKAFPKGQPNAMIARSVERGTSFMLANPFIKSAKRDAQEPVLRTMKHTAEEEIDKIKNNGR